MTEQNPYRDVSPQTLTFEDDGRTPNSTLPTLLYRPDSDVTPGEDLVRQLEALFNQHQWPAQWRGGVFPFHHYHSVSHEVLGIYQGSATLQLGGESGREITVEAGDVLVLPAGTGHCRLEASGDFALTAGYPSDQQNWDLCRSGEEDIAAARQRIHVVALPTQDPLSGGEGALCSLWQGADN